MKIIIGLGNIGKKYENTYHNVGFLVVTKIAHTLGLKFMKKECESDIATMYLEGEKIILAKPRTFMNDSGKAVAAFVKKYRDAKLNEDIIIVYDDIDLVSGDVRVKESGGPGTHNGMRSIINSIGSKEFRRVRIGTDEIPEDMPLVNFVLSNIKPKSNIRKAITLASDNLLSYLKKEKKFADVMNTLNSSFARNDNKE